MKIIQIKEEDLQNLKKLPIQGLNSVCYDYGDRVLKIITNPVLLTSKSVEGYKAFSKINNGCYTGPYELVYCGDKFLGYTCIKIKGNVLYEAKMATFSQFDTYSNHASFFDIDGIIEASYELSKWNLALALEGIKNFDVSTKNVIYTDDKKIKIIDMDFYRRHCYMVSLVFKNNNRRVNEAFRSLFNKIDKESFETINMENNTLNLNNCDYIENYLESLKAKKANEGIKVKTLEDVYKSRKYKRWF